MIMKQNLTSFVNFIKMMLQSSSYMMEKHKNDTTKLTIGDIITGVQEILKEQQMALSNVWVLFKLMLVMSATNASSDCIETG